MRAHLDFATDKCPDTNAIALASGPFSLIGTPILESVNPKAFLDIFTPLSGI